MGRSDLQGELLFEADVEEQLEVRGMTIVKDADLANLRKAGEGLQINGAKAALHEEIGT